MRGPVFLKLGGSLITDKTGVEAVRTDTLARVAQEIQLALSLQPPLQLVLGHGSGSFGHVAAAKYGTRKGVRTEREWRGFAEVSDAAARLNREVVRALLGAGVRAVTVQPSASAMCENGRLASMAFGPIRKALQAGLVPVVYGDVAFDAAQGGAIISTEEIMIFLARDLQPSWLLLAGETLGVLDPDGQVIPLVAPDNVSEIAPFLGGSRGTDVTGGMAGKVQSMLELVRRYPSLRVRIFSGLQPGRLQTVLMDPAKPQGTEIGRWDLRR